MSKSLLTAAVVALSPLALSASALAAPELKPFQEEAKADFDEAMEEPLKAMNDACGTKITVKSEYDKFDQEAWKGRAHYSWCVPVLEEIKSMCEKRPAYKKVISKKITSVACLFTGVKPKEKKDGTNDFTLRNMTLAKGVFTFNMSVDTVNLNDNARTVLEKGLNE